jgi:hypothetical protein
MKLLSLPAVASSSLKAIRSLAHCNVLKAWSESLHEIIWKEILRKPRHDQSVITHTSNLEVSDP